MARSCVIIGGGIAGVSSALALSKLGIQCSVYELRDQPVTIGGAINLTPSALRLLEQLGVELTNGCVVDAIEVFSIYSGSKLGEIPFRKSGHSLRIMREDLQRSLLAALKVAGVPISYGSKLASIDDTSDSPKATAVFSNGERAQADFILGCDGVHSAVRTSYVEPERISIYTGVVAAYAVVDADVEAPIHFQSTAANTGRFGSFITSYINPDRKKIFLTAGMEAPEEKDRQGWKSRGEDHQKTMKEVHRRYQDSALPCLMPLIDRVDEFMFYPIYKLGPEGMWSKGQVLLLGDAGHGMPPQGESTGFAMEDAVLLSRIFKRFPEKDISEIFEVYQKTRKARIDKAYKEAVWRWEQVKDKGWLQQKFTEWLTWLFLWYMKDAFEASVTYDVQKVQLVE